jgi:hypothetical protein
MRIAYNKGVNDALARLKLGNAHMGATGYNPTAAGQAAGAQAAPTITAPPAPASHPMAAGAAKAKVLG